MLVYKGAESLLFLAHKIRELIPEKVKLNESLPAIKVVITQAKPNDCPYRVCRTLSPQWLLDNSCTWAHDVHHVPKCMSCHKAIVLITRRVHGSHDKLYITLILLPQDLSTLFVCLSVFTTEVVIESWPEWDLNPRPLNSIQML